MNGQWRHDIQICPDFSTADGRRVWYAGVALRKGGSVDYDGSGETIELALCDLIDNMADRLASGS